jgi:hypothetical protein
MRRLLHRGDLTGREPSPSIRRPEVAGMLANRVSRMRRGEPERIRDLTAAQKDEAPFYEAPVAAASFGSRCQQGNCLR